jgi:hypothetical protein
MSPVVTSVGSQVHPARRGAYQRWCDETARLAAERERWIDQHVTRQQDRGVDNGLDV